MSHKTALAIFLFLIGHSVSGQLVRDSMNRLIYSENFDSSKTIWPILSNNENLFLVQDGEYVLYRKTTISPFAVVSEQGFDLESFKIITSLKLDRGLTPESSIGLTFMIQPENAGAWFLEFNMNKEFRVRKLSGTEFTNYTGSTKSSGWVKNNSINEATIPTLIDIRFAKGNFDLYFNHKFVLSFSDNEFQSGNIGYTISAGTRGRVDFLYVFTNGLPDENQANNAASESELTTLIESIISLKTQVNELTERNDLLTKTIDAMKSESRSDENEKQQMKAELDNHQAEVNSWQKKYDSVLMVNATLEKYREIITGHENSDLIISLSKSLKTEMEKNKLLRDSITNLQKLIKSNPAGDQKQGSIVVPNQPNPAGSNTTQDNNPNNSRGTSTSNPPVPVNSTVNKNENNPKN